MPFNPLQQHSGNLLREGSGLIEEDDFGVGHGGRLGILAQGGVATRST